MSVLVNTEGQPIRADEIVVCPACGAPKKEFDHVTTFGDFWREVCKKCGVIVASGRGNRSDS